MRAVLANSIAVRNIMPHAEGRASTMASVDGSGRKRQHPADQSQIDAIFAVIRCRRRLGRVRVFLHSLSIPGFDYSQNLGTPCRNAPSTASLRRMGGGVMSRSSEVKIFSP